KVLSYLGAFGGWYLLNEMFDFFKKIKIKYPGIKFLIITQNPPEEVVKQAVKGGADANDIIVKASARADVPLYLALSNWSIFFIKNGYSKIASSPTKLGEIMAMGIPVICNDVGDAGKIIQEGNTGLVIPEFSDREYSSVISRLDELSSLRKEAIRDSAIKNFDLDMGVQSYSDVYCKIG
ncbi:MAG: glycosyltransferase, partial [Bacteroidota bacterium]